MLSAVFPDDTFKAWKCSNKYFNMILLDSILDSILKWGPSFNLAVINPIFSSTQQYIYIIFQKHTMLCVCVHECVLRGGKWKTVS